MSKSRVSTEEQIRQRIEKRYEERTGLLIHMVAFFAVNTVMWMIYLNSGGSFPWPLIVTLGWGIGAVAHVLSYYYEYGAGHERREAFIEREVERELDRMQTRGAYSGKRKNDNFLSDDDSEVSAYHR